jgi:predicted lipid-binding transport protein (Tim44 family)
MGRARLVALATVGIMTGGVLIEAADARVGRSRGGYRSFGNRGTRTFDQGGPGSRMQPMQNNRQTQAGRANAQNNRGSWLQRNPLMAGLMGALAGTVLGAMLMNMLGGMGPIGGMLMMLLMAVLLFMAIAALIRLFKGRQQPSLAGNMRNNNFGGNLGGGNLGGGNLGGGNLGGGFGNNSSYGGFDNAGPGGAPMNTQSREQGLAAIALEDASMTSERLQDALTNQFFQIQEAWSTGDRATLHMAATREMYEELVGDLEEMERRGERNVIKNIVMRSFDVTEAWQEGEIEYVTAHINARLLDYTESNGQIIDGDATTPTQFSEYWTFTRDRGRGDWKLSAINQEA